MSISNFSTIRNQKALFYAEKALLELSQLEYEGPNNLSILSELKKDLSSDPLLHDQIVLEMKRISLARIDHIVEDGLSLSENLQLVSF